MSIIVTAAFLTTVALSAARNILSKSISGYKFGTKRFFELQRLIFFSGFAVLIIPILKNFSGISPLTPIYSLIYALLLITAQWNYTAALGSLNASICVTVYSCGFIFPAVSGALLWNESLTVFKLLGIILTILTIFVSNYEEKAPKVSKMPKSGSLKLIFAMAASGGLGIMQKVQQNSSVAEEKSVFVLLAFLFAGIASLIFEKLSHDDDHRMRVCKKERLCSAAAGVCFACCNLLNTYLAGKLDSAFFFPVQNISVIIASTLISVSVFSEHLGIKEITALALGIAAVVLNR